MIVIIDLETSFLGASWLWFFVWMFFDVHAINSGTSGIWAPCGWKPFLFATYCTAIGVPSGAVYWNEPCASMAPSSPTFDFN